MKLQRFIAILVAVLGAQITYAASQAGAVDSSQPMPRAAEPEKISCDKSAANLSEAFDLAHLISTALCHNMELRQARRSIEGANLQFEEADAKYASDYQFRLNNNTQFGDTSELENSVNTNSTSEFRSESDRLFLTLKWILPWWHKSEFKYEAAKSKVGIDIAQLRYRKKIQDTAFEIYKAYIALLVESRKMQLANRRLELAREENMDAEKNQELGRISDLQASSEEDALINQQIASGDAADSFAAKKTELFGLLGIPAIPLENLEDVQLAYHQFDAENYKLNSAIQYQTREVQLQIAQQALEIDKQEDIWKPQVSTWVGYSPVVESVGNQVSRGNINNLVTLGVQIQVDLPNFSSTSAATKTAVHDREGLIDQIEMITQSTRDRSEQLKNKIGRLNGQLELLEKLRQIREQRFESMRKSLELERITEFDLNAQEADFEATEVTYYEKLADYLIAQAELKRLYGVPLFTEIKVDPPS